MAGGVRGKRSRCYEVEGEDTVCGKSRGRGGAKIPEAAIAGSSERFQERRVVARLRNYAVRQPESW